VLEDLLERPWVALVHLAGGVSRHHAEVVELVPSLVQLRYDGPPAALGHRDRGVSLPAHRPVHKTGRGEPLGSERSAQQPALLDAVLAQDVVVLGTEGRLPVPDQQRHAHQARTTRRARCSR
jgi:hypothetical protein